MYAYVYRIHINLLIHTVLVNSVNNRNTFMKICYLSRQIGPGNLLLCHSASQYEEAFK